MATLVTTGLPPVGTLSGTLGSGGGTILNNPVAPVANPTRLPVQYKELDGSPRIDGADNATVVTRDLIVCWDGNSTPQGFAVGGSWQAAVLDLLGYPVLVQRNPSGVGTGWYVQRYVPWFFPFWSIQTPFKKPAPFLWCSRYKVSPVSMASDLITEDLLLVHRYDLAKVEATFETLSYDILDDVEMVNANYVDGYGNPDESSLARYVTRLPKPGASYQTLPPGSLVFVSGNGSGGVVTVPGSPGRLEIYADLQLTWQRVPTEAIGLGLINPVIAATTLNAMQQPVRYVPPIEDCLGSVNVTDFAGCKKGTLLLSAVVLKPIQSPLGMRLWDVDYVFRWLKAQSYGQLTIDGLTDYVYGHNLILRVDFPSGGKTYLGYDEVVGKQFGGSNALLTNPVDGVNPLNWREFRSLFRVPLLNQ